MYELLKKNAAFLSSVSTECDLDYFALKDKFNLTNVDLSMYYPYVIFKTFNLFDLYCYDSVNI